MCKSTRALSHLIDTHLNDRPTPDAPRITLLRHIRIGDKLLELLIEAMELGDEKLITNSIHRGMIGKPVPPTIDQAIIPDRPTPTPPTFEPPFPPCSDLDAARKLRTKYQAFVKGKTRKQKQGEYYQKMWALAFQLTQDDNGNWSASRAAKLLTGSTSAGYWILEKHYQNRMKNRR
jgi:hypothetical protein